MSDSPRRDTVKPSKASIIRHVRETTRKRLQSELHASARLMRAANFESNLCRLDPAFIGFLCLIFVYILHIFGFVKLVMKWVPAALEIPFIFGIAGMLRYFVEYLLSKAKLSSERKAVLVTGCDAGFGILLCRRLAAKGFLVFATCVFPDSDAPKDLGSHYTKRIRVFEMDVTNETSVQNAAAQVKHILEQPEEFGLAKDIRLWAVVANAGLGLLAPIEVTPMADIENLFSINVFGVIRTIRAFLPLIRKSSGRVVVTSSMAGSFPAPNMVVYSMTKAAIKALAIGLHRELRMFRITCICIEPYFYRTRMLSSAASSPATRIAALEDSEQRRAYIDFLTDWEEQRKCIQTYSAEDLESHLNAFDHALRSARPKRWYFVMSPLLRAAAYIASHFDISYTDFAIAFSRNPLQALDDLVDLSSAPPVYATGRSTGRNTGKNSQLSSESILRSISKDPTESGFFQVSNTEEKVSSPLTGIISNRIRDDCPIELTAEFHKSPKKGTKHRKR